MSSYSTIPGMDTMDTALTAFLAIYLVAILFAFVFGLGAVGVWWAFPFGLTTAGILFWTRFTRTTGRKILEAEKVKNR